MIERNSVLHIPYSNYAFASDEKTMTIRLRAARGNLTSCTLFYGNRSGDFSTPFVHEKMNIVAETSLYSYYEVTFKTLYSRVCYYFKLETEDEWSYYYADSFTQSLADLQIGDYLLDGRSEYNQYPSILRTELAQVPDWLHKAVVYNIFPDSFATEKQKISQQGMHLCVNGEECNSMLGGTLRGVTENLDYIQELGVTCIYLNPIFTAASYHKYDTIDYMHVDPCFGTDADLKKLICSAHDREIRVILDGVFNHCGKNFFAFQDVVEKGKASRYYNWFYRVELPIQKDRGDGKPNYACFAYVADMPKLNTANPEVQEYFCEVCRHWVQDFGIDGWRLDVANEVSKDFWRAFHIAVRQANPECVLIGEIWENAKDWLRYDLLDSAMNYDFRNGMRDFFALRRIDAAEFDNRITDLRMRYAEAYWRAQLNFLDSHDVTRFLSFCDGDRQKMHQAIVFQMLFPGVPSIFYADECGMDGVTEPEYRRPMPWKNEKNSLYDFYKQAIDLRKQTEAANGRYRTLSAQSGSGLYGFSLTTEESEISVWFQTKETTEQIPQNGKLLWSEGLSEKGLSAGGFAVFQSQYHLESGLGQ